MAVIVSKAHKKLLVPATAGAKSLFPDAVRLDAVHGNDYLVVDHSIPNVVLTKHLGFDVPNPMINHYSWHGGNPFKVQLATCTMLVENPRAYVLNHMGCVDADTEYLSPTGWARIADYRGGKAAQYWPDSGEIEFVDPTEYVKLPCAEMVRFKTTRDVDQLLSPEHRVLLDCGLVLPAEEVERTYQMPAIQRLMKFRTTFKVRAAAALPLTDDQIRLQVAVNADGYQPARRVYVRLKKVRKIARLRELLVRAGVQYKERRCNSAPAFHVFGFVPPTKKGFGPTWWACSQTQLEVVANEAVHWDGSARKAMGCGFYSRSKADADFVQYAYSASGCRASLTCANGADYTVHAAHGKTVAGLYGINGQAPRRNVWREPSPDGFKYCFMVPSTFLLLRRNGCIFATGNTGKTKAALWAWDYLNQEGLTGKVLVIAPLSTLHFVWAKEVFMTLPHRKVAILHGSKQKRLDKLAEDADIYVINHDGVKVIYDELKKRTDITTLILDELAVYRNNSDRSKTMRELAQRYQIVWGLTGAPMPNAPTDVWAQCKIITPHTVPKYFRHAQDVLMQKITQFKYVPKADAVKTAFNYMQPSVRFSLDDVVELPDIVSQTLDVDLTDEQRKLYDKVAKELQAMVADKTITAMNAGVAMGKLLQIAGGWVYANEKAVVKIDAKPRIDKLFEVIDGNERKLMVFVPFRHALSGLSHELSERSAKAGGAIEHCVVHGQTPHRELLFNAFQNTDKYKVLLAHPECLAHGLTLTAADTIVWYLPLASLDIYDQANARIRRVGQEHKQFILHLQGTPVEKRIYALLRGKAKVQDQLLDMFEDAALWRIAA